MFCRKICPNREGIDYFRLLGLPRSYSVDTKTAEGNYRALQKTVHPDKRSVNPNDGIPEGFSSLLNKAIRVVKSPTERAMHLLYLQDGCLISESDFTSDPAMLIEMMGFNEEVDDCDSDKKCLESQREINNGRLAECDEKLKTLFADRKFQQVRKVCERMHFLERINDTILRKLNSV